MNTATEAKTESHSESQAKAQLESIREMVAALDRESAAEVFVNGLNLSQCEAILDETGYGLETYHSELLRRIIEEGLNPEGFEFNENEARQAIDEDPLSVEVRSPWYTLGADEDERKPSDFCILLCTGGPAVRIRGELDQYSQPNRAWLEHQDWGTPWTQYYEPGIQDTLLKYASCFYFGE